MDQQHNEENPGNVNYVDPDENNPPGDQANPPELEGDVHMQEDQDVDDDGGDSSSMLDFPPPPPQVPQSGAMQPPQLNVINLNDFRNEPSVAGPSFAPQVQDLSFLLRNGVHHESQKIHKQIPIYVVEDHHHVIPFIHENIRRRFLPIKGNTLIHFDSHPDMLIPKRMPADHAYDTVRLYEAHDIENWIMPNCYTGILEHLIWVKPPWSNQIRNIHQKIYIGKCDLSSTIRLECRENYFISEGLFRPREAMSAIQEITLDCLTLGNRLIEAGDDIGHMKYLSENNDKTPTILDIDLDFFSTRNPFLDLYDEANLYERLRHLFRFIPSVSDSNGDILNAQRVRMEQMDELEILFRHLNEYKRMPDFQGDQPSPIYTEVNATVEAIRQFYDVNVVEWLQMFDAGCTIDDHELPHHVSTNQEMNIMFQCLGNFLDTFLEPPRIITISRSSRDEYTPADQVDYIQGRVLEILNSKFDCAPPILHYLEIAVDEQQQPAAAAPNVANEEMEPISVSSESSSISTFSPMSEEIVKSSSGSGPSRPVAPTKDNSPDTCDEADPICDYEESGPSAS